MLGQLGMSRGDPGGVLQILPRGGLALGEEDHMGAGSLLGMKPQIIFPGGAQGELIVFPVVPATENTQARRRGVFSRLKSGGLFLFGVLLLGAEIAAFQQLFPDGVDLLDVPGLLQGQLDALHILQLLLPLDDLLLQGLLGVFHPGVFFK